VEGGDHTLVESRSGVFITALKTPTLPPATHTNCVLVGHEGLFVIDPGSDDEEELARLRKHIDHLMELGASVQAVLLTHSHRDHTGGAQFVRETYSVPVWAHEKTAAQVNFPIDRHIGHGEILESPGDPGWPLRVLHTPGHDPGHLCFFEESTQTLICGDMVANPGSIVVSQASGGDMAVFIESLESLLAVNSRLLIPAHGQAFAEPNNALQEHIDHRLWRENKVKEAYESGHTTMDALLTASYDDAPKQVLPLALHSLKSHLAKLGIVVPD
jgi:glyoxylase-like metal-dependent hydrolase (beta-lactamase superfamily II)